MNLSNARAAKLSLEDAGQPIVATRRARGPRRRGRLRSIESIREEMSSKPMFATGVGCPRNGTRGKSDYKLAVRVYADQDAAARATLRKLFERDPALKKKRTSYTAFGRALAP